MKRTATATATATAKPITLPLLTMSHVIACTALRTCDLAGRKVKKHALETVSTIMLDSQPAEKLKPAGNAGNAGNAVIHGLRVSLQSDFRTLRAQARVESLDADLASATLQRDALQADLAKLEHQLVSDKTPVKTLPTLLQAYKVTSYDLAKARDTVTRIRGNRDDAYAVSMRSLSHAYDLVHDAVCGLLSAGYDDTASHDDNADAIKAGYKAVHASIYRHKSKKVLKTVYIEDMKKDDDSECIELSYIALDTFTDLHSIDEKASVDAMLSQLNAVLSKRERQVLAYKILNHSRKDISKKLHIKDGTTGDIIKRIRQKTFRMFPTECRTLSRKYAK